MDSLDGQSDDRFDFASGTAKSALGLGDVHFEIFLSLAKGEGLVTLASYQAMAGRTSIPGSAVDPSVMGLCGEAGEVAELYKKALYHGHPMDREKLVKELGDVLWYIADLASKANISLQEVANKNIRKLMRRYPDGFSQKASVERTDE